MVSLNFCSKRPVIGQTQVSQNTKTNNKNKKNSVRASVAAASVAQIAALSSTPLGLVSNKGIVNASKQLSAESKTLMNDAADKILINSGLSKKGVEILNISSAPLNLTSLPDALYDMINPVSSVAKGKNAFFTSKPVIGKNILGFTTTLHKGNFVGLNREKLPNAVFHELGHAFNHNNSAFWRTMQKMRTPAMIIPVAIALFGAFSKQSVPEEGKELTKAQKANNFVRNNAGKLAFLSFLPVIAEETMASVRGCKWAKELLPKDLFKNVLKTNVAGGLSYVATGVGLALSAFAAVKIKDALVQKAENKNNT